MRRGATVTLTDTRDDDRRRRAAARRRRRAGARRAPARDAARRGPDRAEPRRAADAARHRRGARGGRAGHRRDGAGVALAPRTDRRDHRHEREVDDDDADRPDARGGRACRCSSAATSACALSAQVDDSTADTIHVIEASSFQLEGSRDLPSVDCGAPELLARPPRSSRDVAEYAAAKARIFANQTADDWAVLNADDEASQMIAQDARSQRLLFATERELPRRRRRRRRRDRAALGRRRAGPGPAVGRQAARPAPAGGRRGGRGRRRHSPASSPTR